MPGGCLVRVRGRTSFRKRRRMTMRMTRGMRRRGTRGRRKRERGTRTKGKTTEQGETKLRRILGDDARSTLDESFAVESCPNGERGLLGGDTNEGCKRRRKRVPSECRILASSYEPRRIIISEPLLRIGSGFTSTRKERRRKKKRKKTGTVTEKRKRKPMKM